MIFVPKFLQSLHTVCSDSIHVPVMLWLHSKCNHYNYKLL